MGEAKDILHLPSSDSDPEMYFQAIVSVSIPVVLTTLLVSLKYHHPLITSLMWLEVIAAAGVMFKLTRRDAPFFASACVLGSLSVLVVMFYVFSGL